MISNSENLGLKQAEQETSKEDKQNEIIPKIEEKNELAVNDKTLLDELKSIQKVKIEQSEDFKSELTGCCPSRNVLNISYEDESGKYIPIFQCTEGSDCLNRICCPSNLRAFSLKLINKINESNQEYINYERKCSCSFCFCFAEYCYCDKCFCCNRPGIEGRYFSNGVYSGKVVEAFTLCSPDIIVYNRNNEPKYTLRIYGFQCGFHCKSCQCKIHHCGTCYCKKCCCCEYCRECCCETCNCETCDYQLNIDICDYGTVLKIGSVTKIPENNTFCEHRKSTYVVDLPKLAKPEDKLNLLAAIMLVDYRFF